MAQRGVHGRDGHELDTKLRRDLQATYFAQGRTESDVRRCDGREADAWR